MKESLKRTTNSKGCTQEISSCPLSNTFMPLSALSTMSLPSVQTVPKEVEVVMRDWIERTFALFDNEPQEASQLKITKVGFLPPASRYYIMLFAIFLKTLNFFLHQLNSKNNGPVSLFKNIFWH